MSEQAITLLLQRVKAGEKELLNDIYSRLYTDIKSIAQFQINKLNTGGTITPTVLAHDCYIKLLKQNKVNIKDSGHFLNCLSISMRQLLIDVYRSKLTAKNQHIDITQDFGEIQGDTDIDFKILELDRLLDKIDKINPVFAEILNYKLILSMTFSEIAEVMGKSERQIIRIWNQAKSLLMALSKD
ncbi:MAG: ECF-type sigma factor [Proteobacteria bacterium]|nr:ECF-type sigma factor [Pseudomonadota bacterium]